MTRVQLTACFFLMLVTLSFARGDGLLCDCETSCGECEMYEGDFYFSNPSFKPIAVPYLKYQGGSGRSYNHGYTSIGSLIALYQHAHRNYVFLDLQGTRLISGNTAANFGIGYRMFSPGYWEMFGVNVYYDLRDRDVGTFRQLGVGFEFLGKCWDFRANGYVPLHRRKHLKSTETFRYPGNLFARRNLFERGMWGLDIEVGTDLLCLGCVNVYGAVGSYCVNSLCCNSVTGGMGRLQVDCGNYWTGRFYITYDDFFDTKYQGEIRFSFPLGRAFECLQCLFRPPVRNDIIILEDVCLWKSNF